MWNRRQEVDTAKDEPQSNYPDILQDKFKELTDQANIGINLMLGYNAHIVICEHKLEKM